MAVAECCLGTGRAPVGAEVDIVSDDARRDFLLFGEDQTRVIVSAAASNGHALLEIARRHGIPAEVIGRVGGDRLVIGNDVDLSLSDVEEVYMTSIGERMEREESGLF